MESAAKCKKEHSDPEICQENGEQPGPSITGHLLTKCGTSNPDCDESCAQALIKCGYSVRPEKK